MNNSWTSGVDAAVLHDHQNVFKYGLIKLVSWPDLAQVPEPDQPIVARICALLSRKLSAGRLVPLVLSAPENEVFNAMSALMQRGHLALASSDAPDAADALAPETEASANSLSPATVARAAEPRRRSLIGKLWARLAS